jgi:hypothetical protein
MVRSPRTNRCRRNELRQVPFSVMTGFFLRAEGVSRRGANGLSSGHEALGRSLIEQGTRLL